MKSFLIAVPAAFALAGIAYALPDIPSTQSPGEQCSAAIAAAERDYSIPPHLMAAIGRVESGRRDSATGVTGAWPWTINAEGEGSYFVNKADAVKAVHGLQARGIRSIDVGCMQINLRQQPSAFFDLNTAFEPAVNADYAGRLLVQLHQRTGEWLKATASFHSGNPWEGNRYAAKVTLAWADEQRRAAHTLLPLPGPPQVGLLANGIAPPPVRQALSPSTTADSLPPRTTTLAMTLTGTIPPSTATGQTMPPAGMRVAQSGRVSGGVEIGPGRRPDGYRSAPVRMVMLSQLTTLMPFAEMMR